MGLILSGGGGSKSLSGSEHERECNLGVQFGTGVQYKWG